MKIAILIAISFLVFASGCSEFQLYSERENVTVQQMSPNIFTVNFCGNAYMSQDEVDKYALQRASEEALSKGYSSFVILKRRDDSQVCMLNPAGTTRKNMGRDQFPSSGYTFQPMMKPNVNLTIQCFRANEKLPEGAIDAAGYLMKNFPALEGGVISDGRK